MPITLSLAVFPGWLYPLLIAAFYATIELITNMVLEPIFYGRSAGVSEVDKYRGPVKAGSGWEALRRGR